MEGIAISIPARKIASVTIAIMKPSTLEIIANPLTRPLDHFLTQKRSGQFLGHSGSLTNRGLH
jgi:hypothetical protein